MSPRPQLFALLAVALLAPRAAAMGDGPMGSGPMGDAPGKMKALLQGLRLKVGEFRHRNETDRKSIFDSINGTTLVADNTSMTACVDIAGDARPEFSLPNTQGGAKAPRVAFRNWGSARKALVQSYAITPEGLQSLGLTWRADQPLPLFLISVERLGLNASVISAENFSFLITVPGICGGLRVFSHTESDPNGTEVTREGGTVTLVSAINCTWEVNCTHTSAFMGMPDAVVDNAADRMKGMLQGLRLKVGDFRRHNATERRAIFDSINGTIILANDTSVTASVDITMNNRPELPLPITPGTTRALRVMFRNWGSARKALVQAIMATIEGLQGLGVSWPVGRRLPLFAISVERLDANASVISAENFSFMIAVPGVCEGLRVLSHTDTSPSGVDVTQEGGTVTLVSPINCTWEINCTHTSAFTGDAGNATDSPSPLPSPPPYSSPSPSSGIVARVHWALPLLLTMIVFAVLPSPQ